MIKYRKTGSKTSEAMSWQSLAKPEREQAVQGLHGPKKKKKAISGVTIQKLGRNALNISFGSRGFNDIVVLVAEADPLKRVELERLGVPARFVRSMAEEMDIPARRLYDILGVSKATANRLVATDKRISGAGGHSAVAMVSLIAEVKAMLEESTAEEAADVDAARWVGQWIERPQPSLGGQKPSDLLDTPTGVDVVTRALGAIVSGAYQ